MKKLKDYQRKYNKVLDKKGFCIALSDMYDLTLASIQSNWFNNGLLPKKYDVEVNNLLDTELRTQIIDIFEGYSDIKESVLAVYAVENLEVFTEEEEGPCDKRCEHRCKGCTGEAWDI